jgi:N-formylglutamate deformylase
MSRTVNGQQAIAILHIPHSSTVIPVEEQEEMVVDGLALQAELLAMTDHYTDELFGLESPMVTQVVFPVSRLLVDPERFEDDAQEPMSERGMGVIYTRGSQGNLLREMPDAGRRAHLLARYYHPHHKRLNQLCAEALGRFGRCLVIDCHSFPSRALPYETNQLAHRPAICLGTDDFHTPVWLSEWLHAAFTNRRLEVANNTPFAGSLVPSDFYREDKRVSSIMIEVRRDIYMDETTGHKHSEFDRVQRMIQQVITELIITFATDQVLTGLDAP